MLRAVPLSMPAAQGGKIGFDSFGLTVPLHKIL